MDAKIRIVESNIVIIERHKIFDPESKVLQAVVKHSNALKLCEPDFIKWSDEINSLRLVAQPPVNIIRYKNGVKIDTRLDYLMSSEDGVIAEYIAPWLKHTSLTSLEQLWNGDVDGIVTSPCVLACRYGEMVWGHWFLEIFAKIVIAEKIFPKKFIFAVPSHLVARTTERSYSHSVLEAFDAYNIDRDRIVPLENGRTYQFGELYDIEHLRVKGIFHSKVLDTIRSMPGISIEKGRGKGSRYAALRAFDQTRATCMRESTIDILKKFSIDIVDLRKIPFREQVGMALRGELILNANGSGLTALVFSQPKTVIGLLSPANWYDDYFINIFQQLNISYVDIRGKSAATQKHHSAYAPYFIDELDLLRGLEVIVDMIKCRT